MTSIISQIQKELRDSISITDVITSKVQNHINVGEKFKAKFTISNQNSIRVKIYHISVSDSAYAKVVGTNYDATDRIIGSGSSTQSIEFEFEAIRTWPWSYNEWFATVKVYAKFDPQDIYYVRKSQAQYEPIEPMA